MLGLEDIPEHLPGGRCRLSPQCGGRWSLSEFIAYWVQLSPQTKSHVCELIRCFARVMGVGMGEEARPGRPPGGGGTLVQPYRLRSD